MTEPKSKKVVEKFTWLLLESNGKGINVKCNRKLALERELALKNKEKCNKLDVIEALAIKMCLNNAINDDTFYYLSELKI